MGRFMHDLADAWEWHERWADFKEAERARWAKANEPAPTHTVRFDITEQESRKRKQDITDGLLPF